MLALVVDSFGKAPTCQDLAEPEPGDGEVLVDVVAAGLHPRVRSQADGSHYTGSGVLPLVPGIDGVGRAPDGTLRYFVLPDTTMGAMAERTVVDLRRSVVLPEGSDPVTLAAGMNPAMSSWVALRRRIAFERGWKVLVLGATGNAGRMAIEVSRHLGAAYVVGAGRRPERLAVLGALGADATVSLDGAPAEVARELGKAAGDVDVVLDYLWGEPAAGAMAAVVRGRHDRERPLTWIQIGAVAGPAAAVPSAALRASGLRIVGSGQGSVPTRDILAELPGLAAELTKGTFRVDARAVPLADAEAVWSATDGARRTVVTP
jgi:NADPH:quinone reductase-like Zn-dependent oxidoreductase